MQSLPHTSILFPCSIDFKSLLIYFQPLVRKNLVERSSTFESYLRQLEKGRTNGMEVTLKIISHMVKQHVCVLVQNFLWLSADIDIDHAGIFYMYQDGVFHGCTRLTYEALPINFTEMLQEYGTIQVAQPQSSIVNRSQLHASSEADGEHSTDQLSNSVVAATDGNVLPIKDISQDSNNNSSTEKEGEPKTDEARQPCPP